MESATILMPPSTSLSGILLSLKTKYSQISTLYQCTQNQLHVETTKAAATPKKSGKIGSFKKRNNLQYKKKADSVLLSLFMRTNGKCNNSQVP